MTFNCINLLENISVVAEYVSPLDYHCVGGESYNIGEETLFLKSKSMFKSKFDSKMGTMLRIFH